MDHHHYRKKWQSEIRVGQQSPVSVDGQSGFMTLVILILVAVLSAYGLEMYVRAHSENKIARGEATSRQAVYAAEGGLAWSKVMLGENPDFTGGVLNVGDGLVEVKVIPQDEGFQVISTATYGMTQRKISTEMVKIQDQFVIKKYQEIHGDG